MALYDQLSSGAVNLGVDKSLYPFEVESKRIFFESLQTAPLYSLFSKDVDGTIVLHDMAPGEGVQWRVPRLNQINYMNPVTNFDLVSGNMQQITFDACPFNAIQYSFPVQVRSQMILQQGTPIKVPNYVSRQIIEATKARLNYDLLSSATVGRYPAISVGSALTMNGIDNAPSFDRALIGSFVAANTQNGFMSRTAYTQNQTFQAMIAANFNGSSTQAANTTGLSVAHLLQLKQMAAYGNAPDKPYRTEAQVAPAKVEMYGGWPVNKFIYLAHPSSLLSLYKDGLFNSATFNKGFAAAPDQPNIVRGGQYLGDLEGISIYQCPELAQFSINNTASNDGATVNVAWNLFLGAGAMSLGWANRPIIKMQEDTINNFTVYTSHEMRGQGPVVFPTRSTANANTSMIEQAIFSSFVGF